MLIAPLPPAAVCCTAKFSTSSWCITPTRRIAALDILTLVLLDSFVAVDKNLPYAIQNFLKAIVLMLMSLVNSSVGVNVASVNDASGFFQIIHSICSPAAKGTKSNVRSIPSILLPVSHSGDDVFATKSSA